MIERGYAWAASSYSKNGYDVRAGVEDTNELALAFTTIARGRNVELPPPKRFLIAGASMGGHIAAAAVERETLAAEHHHVSYAGALPMCGVLGDTDLADYFAAYHLAAMFLAGKPARQYPIADWDALQGTVQASLWSAFPARTTAAGERLKRIDMYLSGGARPFFAEGFADPALQQSLWSTGGRERQFNAAIARAVPAPDANPRRGDGLRWVPVLHGEFDVPVLTLHTLGDIYVPIRMEQVYRQRAEAHGRARLLVQRLIRDTGHCAFTEAEGDEAFDALAAWVAGGPRPEGDDVAPRALASPNAGCRFTRNVASPQNYTDLDKRTALQARYPPCS